MPVSAEPGFVKRYSTPASFRVWISNMPPVPVMVFRMRASLAFHAARGQAFDHVFLQVDVDGDDGERREHGTRHEKAPAVDVAGDEARQPDRQRAQLHVRDEDEGVEEL